MHQRKIYIHIIIVIKITVQNINDLLFLVFLMQKRHTTHDIDMSVQRLHNYDYEPYEYLAENVTTSI